MSKLYLIDAMSVVFRAYHAMKRSELKSPTGEPTFAFHGFANILTSLIDGENPEYVVMAFDSREPTFRHEMFEDYKATRDAFPEDLAPQLDRIKQFIDYLGIPRIEKPGFEADDIVGTLSLQAENDGREVVCLTSDKDFYQLVGERVKLYKPSRKSGETFDVVDLEAVEKKFGGKPEQVIDALALLGDSSDNVPGVKGVGEKTAIPLIQKFGTIENLYENLDSVDKPAVRKKLEQGKENAFLSKELVTIVRDMEIDYDYEKLKRGEPDFAKIDSLFKELGINNLRKRWRDRAEKAGVDVASVPADEEEFAEASSYDTIAETEKKYVFVNTEKALDEMIEELKSAEILSVDLETSSLNRDECEIVGIALCAKENRAFYAAVADKDAIESKQDSLFDGQSDLKEIVEKSLAFDFVVDKLKPILEDENLPKCGQNLKFDAYILRRFGINLTPIKFDSMAASYVLNPDERHNLDVLSKKYLNYEPIPIKVLIGEKKSKQKSMRDIDPETISDYACEDADLALKLRNALAKELEKENLTALAEEIEFPLVEILTKMEANGAAIDTGALSELSKQINKEVTVLVEKIYREAGVEFNIDSPKQLGEIMFDKMGIPAVKKTKTGYSTDASVLSKLEDMYPIAEYMLDYRQLTKLKSTYVEALPKLVNPKTGRIHTTFNQTATSTGRLSSTDPNLQNIPIRTALGKRIRKAFAPQKKDRCMLAADYSQIELRIMAHICGDPHMLEAFKNDLDIHSSTAAALYGVSQDEVDSDMRRKAKTVNFGIMYGLGAFGLSQRLGIPRGEAKKIIDDYFATFPGIRKYIDMTIESARKKGYAETLKGRRRYFDNINASNRNLRTADERAAINMPIQGTASDMIKIAMIKIEEAMRKEKMKSMMILQVHDELVFEAQNDEAAELERLVVENMQSALSLGEVPVKVDAGIGGNWFEAR